MRLIETNYFFATFLTKTILYILLLFVWLSRVRKGLKITRAYNLLAWIIFFVTFFMTLHLSFFEQPISLPFNNIFWGLSGSVMILFGTVMLIWSLVTFNYLGPKEEKLITHGPYSHTRNPQYFSLTLISFGQTLLLNSFCFLVFSIILVVFSYLLILVEEKELEKLFGKKFLNYKSRVPRFFPK